MSFNRQEWGAILGTVGSVIIVIAWPFLFERRTVEAHSGPASRVITLTGVAATGTWTDEEVRGGTYFAKKYRPAEPLLTVGERVFLRLKSADVTHTFYSPDLGIGPVEVYPGHVAEVMVLPKKAGVYPFYCTSVCGRAHFGMRGRFVVRNGVSPEVPDPVDYGEYWKEPPPPEEGLVARGRWLFRKNGCFTCHGPNAEGGVANPNYVKKTVPALNVLAERMFLFSSEDRQAIVNAMEKGTPLQNLAGDPPVPRFGAVLAQYNAIRKIIENGSPAGKLDADGPTPPLQMRPWAQRLSREDIDALVTYLLTLEPPVGNEASRE
ncbi:MAG: c-type cytochrome [Candidatus Binatia bacterium]